MSGAKIIHQPTVSRAVMNLAHLSTQNARRFPDRDALRWGDARWTWTQFDARVSALAQVLRDQGVQAGQAVLVHSANSNELLESMFAVFRIGAVWVPTNFRLLPDDVVYMAQLSGARLFLCQTDFLEHAAAVQRVRADVQVLWLRGAASAPSGGARVADLMAAYPQHCVADAPVQSDSPCWLFFTSGTTGKPKAAVLTHGQLGFVLTNHLCDLMPALTEDDGSLVVAPLSHGAGIHQLNVIARGAVTVLMPSERFDAATAFALIEQHRLTNLFTVPTILKMLVEDPSVDAHDHSSLRYVIYAGAPMYGSDQARALQTLGSVLVQYYGLGEVTGCITVLPPRLHTPEEFAARPATCGIARTGMQISIQDDDGRVLPDGEQGEVCVVGPGVFAGYLNNPDANAKSFRNGWFRTGDMGRMDAQGFLYLTGRASDMYISGGSNIYPREIEEKLLTHEALHEVAVLGIPDPKWGEIGVAVCVAKPGAQLDEAALLHWMHDKIARYKLPRRVFFWDELPKSGYGKVPKALVREALQRRGLTDANGRLRDGG